ncbi:MAG TPA: hypothetical protein DIC22_06040 [Chitinophagaceae bacterium]|nr:hypothetical protein [Chitinophagaceae bacterium]
MKKIITAFIFLIPLVSHAQTDVLILKKNGKNIKIYAPGQPIIFETIYEQWLGGTLTDLRNDSVFINNIPFHVREIKTMRRDFTNWNYQTDGTILIIAGVGVLFLNVANGIYTHENSGSWVRTSGWIVSGALILGGLLLKRARYKNYPIGKKYTLQYMNIRVESPLYEKDPVLKPTEPAKQPDAH